MSTPAPVLNPRIRKQLNEYPAGTALTSDPSLVLERKRAGRKRKR